MSFRDAYVQVGQHLDQVPVPEHDAPLASPNAYR